MAKAIACLQAFPSSLLPPSSRAVSRPNSLPLPFRTPATQVTFRVELVTSRNRDYRPYAISEHSFFVCHLHWEFTDGFVQGEPNMYEYFWIRSSAEVRNDTESAWIIVEGSRSWKLDFPNICNFFHRFSKDTYNDYLLPNIIDSFLLLFW